MVLDDTIASLLQQFTWDLQSTFAGRTLRIHCTLYYYVTSFINMFRIRKSDITDMKEIFIFVCPVNYNGAVSLVFWKMFPFLKTYTTIIKTTST
jgi:hypothetical protein